MSVPGLSEIEQEIVLLVAGGRSHREVAAALRLSLKTVEWHAVRAERKLEHAAALRDRIRQGEPRPIREGGSA